MCSGPLVEDRPPPVIATFAPERTLYVTSFTKITVPGLRIGYLAAPDRYVGGGRQPASGLQLDGNADGG